LLIAVNYCHIEHLNAVYNASTLGCSD